MCEQSRGLWVVAWLRGTRGSAVVAPGRAELEGKVGLPIVAWGSGIPAKGQKGEQSQGWAGQGQQEPGGVWEGAVKGLCGAGGR